MKVLSLIAFVLATVTTWVLVTPLAMALPDNVTNSKHNFSGNATGVSSAQYVGEFNEVCKYCHTPHNAGPTGPLWNKANRTAATSDPRYYRMYTSSTSLTTETRRNSTLDANSPSLLCLGCHDGKTAMNVMHSSRSGVDASGVGYPAGTKFIMNNGSYAPTPLDDNLGGFGIPAQGLNLGKAADGSNDRQGNDLTNDHPIGFNYDAAQQLRPGALFAINTVNPKIKFSGASKKVECTTCHNPHADADDVAVSPFLVMSNTGSALCLSCHNK